ncbi:DUF4328 domain-containing protein [Streptomyces sp. NPDC046805]|uniref:DUF4328 domain-containing protein n=1 Tax=Streptomyces sp. NPDC046805 TaxID=3155134 RepID=UPI0033E9616A
MDDHIARHPLLRPVRRAADCSVAALILAGAAWAARAVWEVRLAMAGQPASGPPDQGGGWHRPLTALENAYHVVTAVSHGVVLLCGFVFVAWLWRVRDNGVALSRERPRYPGFWVYLGWVLPIANLWVPRGLVADAYRASAPGRRLPTALNVWWALWLVGLGSGVGVGIGAGHTDSPDELVARAYSGVWLLLAYDAAVVGAAVAAVFVVRAVTAAQQERAATWTAPAPDLQGPEAA